MEVPYALVANDNDIDRGKMLLDRASILDGSSDFEPWRGVGTGRT